MRKVPVDANDDELPPQVVRQTTFHVCARCGRLVAADRKKCGRCGQRISATRREDCKG